MLREVAEISTVEHGSVTLAVTFNEFDSPCTIHPLDNRGIEITEGFEFNHNHTDGTDLEPLANKAVLLTVFADPMPLVSDFPEIFVATVLE